jgi:formylglycine-generating enzyme required for sulfatase activity
VNAPGTIHPTDQELQAHSRGKLDDSAAESVDEHLAQCPDCRQRASELTSDSFRSRLQKAQRPPSNPTMSSSHAGSESGDATPARHTTPPPAAETMPPGLADHPDYEIRRELGRGGMGVVYLAHNRLMGRDEVLKVIGRRIIERPGAFDRFLREIRAVARLRHDNVVAAYSAFRLDESLVFAMEYVEGYDLSGLIKSHGPLPVAHACSFIHQAALGLQHAHEHAMVHRDIKPANLMLSRQKNRPLIKVLDFGLSKATRENPLDSGLTHDGQLLGTPDYIAPEQVSDAQRADIRADIYSLGCTLYYLLSGGPPFHGTSLYDILQAHHSMDAKPLNFMRPEVPVELAALVAKMMAKEPARRFQTPGDVAEALAPFFKKGGTGFKSTKPQISQAGQSVARGETADVASVPPWPATPVAQTRPPTPERPATTPRPESRWASLIDVQETERSRDEAPVMVRARRPPWAWPAVAAAILFGFVALGIIITIKTQNGETRITIADDSSVHVQWDGTVEEHAPSTGGPAGNANLPGDPSRAKPPSGQPTPSEKGSPNYRPSAVPSAGPPRHEAPPARVSPKGQPLPPSDTPTRVQPAFTNSIGMGFASIPAGEFLMGSTDEDKDARFDEKPQHRVRITRPFYLGVYEVTQGQYQAVMGENPSKFKGSDELPVEQVNWLDAAKFCNALSEREGRNPHYHIEFARVTIVRGDGYRLPTEAEWEYACRAGSQTLYFFGDDPNAFSSFAWLAENSDQEEFDSRRFDDGRAKHDADLTRLGPHTHPVGQKRPNAFGLYDMCGNVAEWCWDCHNPDYYMHSQVDDPSGPKSPTRVIRGGSYLVRPRRARSAKRDWHPPEKWGPSLGFRVAVERSGR